MNRRQQPPDRGARRRSGATTPATAVAGRSTRSATAAEAPRLTVTRRPSLATDLARLAVLAALGASVLGAYAAFRIWQVSTQDERPAADAIVVLGASQEHGRPLAVLRARLDHAIELYRTNIARYFVVTGGTAEGDVLSEAEAARRYAIARGVAPEAILAETAGHDTLSSLRGVADLFRDRSLTRAVFVSDGTHMYRVLRMARDLGLTAHGSPTTRSPIDREPGAWVSAVAHELLALADYFLIDG